MRSSIGGCQNRINREMSIPLCRYCLGVTEDLTNDIETFAARDGHARMGMAEIMNTNIIEFG